VSSIIRAIDSNYRSAVGYMSRNDSYVYEPLMKHWNRRKKKYPLDPILGEENITFTY